MQPVKNAPPTIAYATDDRYADITAVSAYSAAKNAGKTGLQIAVLHSGLAESSVKKIALCAEGGGAKVKFVRVDESAFGGLPLSHWLGVQAWFRIAIADICKDCERVLYLDCDTLVCGDISELYNIDLSGKYAAVVRDIWNVEKYCKRLKMKSREYFNSGVMLINCALWRKDNLREKITEYATGRKVEYCDQDCLNKVIDEKKLMLDLKYNYLEPWWRGDYHDYKGAWKKSFNEAKAAPKIIHFTGLKPSVKGCGHSYAELWRKYAFESPIGAGLREKYEASAAPKIKKTPLLKKLFFSGNVYKDGKKTKVLRLFGLEFKRLVDDCNK